MAEAGRCPECGAELAGEAPPGGICPGCLLRAGLSDYSSQTHQSDFERDDEPDERRELAQLPSAGPDLKKKGADSRTGAAGTVTPARGSGVVGRLTRIRELSGMNKKDFSAALGMSAQAWGEYENGKRDLPLSVAKRLRKAYSIPLEFTYFGIKSDLPHRIATEL